MTREIKFRGKLIKNDGWVQGDLVHDDKGNSYVYPKEAEGLYLSNRVHPETVGQFIGLHDCKGNAIYEGDIIRSSNGVMHRIEYDSNTACFTAVRLNSKVEMKHGLTMYKIEQYGREVIGNIYDNSGLLKQE